MTTVSHRNALERIQIIRAQRVILDRDLAELYGVSTKQLNQQVRRNRNRFPSDFLFQLTSAEAIAMRSQIVTASKRNLRYLPLAFTEHGVAMLSSVLNSSRAIQVNIAIMRAFVAFRRVTSNHALLAKRLHELEIQMKRFGDDMDDQKEQIEQIFSTIRALIQSPPNAPGKIGFRACR